MKILTKQDDFVKSLNCFKGSCMDQLDDNVIIQCFSPIITSHRIMNCQFGNSYNYIKCKDNLVIYFEEYMGYLFVAISNKKEDYMKKFTNVCVTVVRYLCGPDVYQLKANAKKSALADKLIDGWINLESNDQAIHVEAVEQLTVNPDLTSTTIQILRESVDNIISQIECILLHQQPMSRPSKRICVQVDRINTPLNVVIVDDNLRLAREGTSFQIHCKIVPRKFTNEKKNLPTAKELSSADILFLTILFHSSVPEKTENKSNSNDISSYQILLAGPEGNPKCLPHVVHIIPISNGLNLLYLLEIGNPAVAASLYETFCHLHIMQQVQIQRDKDILQPAFENLDLANRKLSDSLKKNKNSTVELSHKNLNKKWEVIRKKYQEYIKNSSEEALLRAETLGLGFLENLKELLGLTSVDDSVLISSANYIKQVAALVGDKLETYEEFFKAKGMKNFSLGSDSLTINKYLEEFPGLVHFLYIDRNTHRITTPTLDFNTEEGLFNKNKTWFMIDFAKKYLQRGCMQLMWKDTTFHYAYFIWFEDISGAPLKPSVFPDQISSLPGLLCEDFYQKLKGICFPKMQASKVRCYEIFCLHLGLVTASCVLEQNRRLAATISELRGHPCQATDFL